MIVYLINGIPFTLYRKGKKEKKEKYEKKNYQNTSRPIYERRALGVVQVAYYTKNFSEKIHLSSTTMHQNDAANQPISVEKILPLQSSTFFNYY